MRLIFELVFRLEIHEVLHFVLVLLGGEIVADLV